jgi:hypothetical protein
MGRWFGWGFVVMEEKNKLGTRSDKGNELTRNPWLEKK